MLCSDILRVRVTLLHAFLEVVNAAPLKSGDSIAGTTRWEARMAVLKNRYGEELTPCVKLAVLVGLLPKEYQGMVVQNLVGKMGDQMEYEQTREQIINSATPKSNMMRPVPMDTNAVDLQSDNDGLGKYDGD